MTTLTHLDNGRVLPTCGFETGLDVMLLAPKLSQVNCPLCHLMIDRVPVVPGKEITLRRSHPPYGVDPAAHYSGPFGDGVTSMPEFAHEHRARGRLAAWNPLARVLLIIALTVALIVTTAVIALADVPPTGDSQDPPRPEMSPAVTNPPQPPPAND
jgi:hypothetical protein